VAGTDLPGVWQLARSMGPAWVASRSAYALVRRMGWLRLRCPVGDWADAQLSDLAPGLRLQDLPAHIEDRAKIAFFVGPHRKGLGDRLQELIPAKEAARLHELPTRLRAGRMRLFHHDGDRKVGWPVRWHRHPSTGQEWPRVHWSLLEDLGDSDVKWLWELSRFGYAYDLVRAHWLGAEDAAEVFWELVEDFARANPPNVGVHWLCGQECSFRVFAWLFGLFALAGSSASTPERQALLLRVLATHGERIEANLGFARLQKNNHAVNEALALFSLGTLLPCLRSAQDWESKGRRVLEEEASRQIYDDGAYVQHSLNYHRLVVESYAWALLLARRAKSPLSAETQARVGSAVELLLQLSDELSGRAPNYGSNDGARLLPLDGCAFEDYRPSLQLAGWAAWGERPIADGAWNEPLLWLGGAEALAGDAVPRSRQALTSPVGGYATLRSGDAWVFSRACEYRDRPAQADQLHVDLWWRGANVLGDPGTYSYNAAPPWRNGLSTTSVHNTLTIDGLDQMVRGPRFVWLGWSRGRILRSAGGARLQLWEAEHEGYLDRLGIVARRLLLLAGDRFLVVIDELHGGGRHEISSQWLAPDATNLDLKADNARLDFQAGPCGVQFRAADAAGSLSALPHQVAPDDGRVAGWCSTRYQERRAVPTLALSYEAELPIRQVTVVSLGSVAAKTRLANDTLRVRNEWARLELSLRPLGSRAQTLLLSANLTSPTGEEAL
jgi:hypothetical protein